MQRMTLSHILLTSLIGTIALIPIVPAQASLYRSTNGKTEFRITEWNATRVDRPGSYTTRVGNQTWNGSFKVNVDGGPTNMSYSGTFEDSPAGNTQIKCTGTIGMVRQSITSIRGMDLAIYWDVTGGNQCPSIGKKFTMKIPEALPVADKRGDYNQSWGRWQVISEDGKLNCRATPNGTVVHILNSGHEIFFDGRFEATITMSNGSPWLYVPYLRHPYTEATSKPCYVRANARYVDPLSIGF
jgi:hypothetical protein